MATYTYRIETSPEIIVWIDCDGQQFMRQPHHPNAYMNAPWDNVADAEAWAVERIAKFEEEANLVVQYQENKQSAIAKLLALGLTEEEANALVK